MITTDFALNTSKKANDSKSLAFFVALTHATAFSFKQLYYLLRK